MVRMQKSLAMAEDVSSLKFVCFRVFFYLCLAHLSSDNSLTKVRSCDKKCSNCATKQPVARRKCVNCSSPFPEVKKDLEKLKQKKMTNITQQRKLMEGRADILHMHHSCDVVIMMHRKHGNGDTLTFYGTEGAGVSFIGNKADVKAPEGGKMALLLFRKFMEDLKSKNKRKPITQDPSEGSETSTTSQPTLRNGQPVRSISPEVFVPFQFQYFHGCISVQTIGEIKQK